MRKKLKKHGRALAKVDDEHRHQVRKDAKKLRYGAEFFGSLCDANNKTRRHRKFLAAMSTMQDCLGDLNDLATGAGCAQRAWTGKPLARDTVISHADKDALIVAAQGAVDDVLDAKLLALTGLLQGWPARRCQARALSCRTFGRWRRPERWRKRRRPTAFCGPYSRPASLDTGTFFSGSHWVQRPGELEMFLLLTILTTLIASMFIVLVASTLRELGNENRDLRATTLRRTRH